MLKKQELQVKIPNYTSAVINYSILPILLLLLPVTPKNALNTKSLCDFGKDRQSNVQNYNNMAFGVVIQNDTSHDAKQKKNIKITDISTFKPLIRSNSSESLDDDIMGNLAPVFVANMNIQLGNVRQLPDDDMNSQLGNICQLPGDDMNSQLGNICQLPEYDMNSQLGQELEDNIEDDGDLPNYSSVLQEEDGLWLGSTRLYEIYKKCQNSELLQILQKCSNSSILSKTDESDVVNNPTSSANADLTKNYDNTNSMDDKWAPPNYSFLVREGEKIWLSRTRLYAIYEKSHNSDILQILENSLKSTIPSKTRGTDVVNDQTSSVGPMPSNDVNVDLTNRNNNGILSTSPLNEAPIVFPHLQYDKRSCKPYCFGLCLIATILGFYFIFSELVSANLSKN